jgi:hypothetical protein
MWDYFPPSSPKAPCQENSEETSFVPFLRHLGTKRKTGERGERGERRERGEREGLKEQIYVRLGKELLKL